MIIVHPPNNAACSLKSLYIEAYLMTLMTTFDFTTQLILQNERVRLEPLQESHFEDLLPICMQAPDLLRYSPSAFGTADHLQAYISGALQARAAAQRYPFVTFDQQSNKIVGSTSFGNVSNEHRRLEIGWTWLAPFAQRTGINRNAKSLQLTYAFETLGFERVEFKADARNEPSRRAMEAIGATYEGTLRSHTLMPDGYRRATVYYSILKEEWEQIKKERFARLM